MKKCIVLFPACLMLLLLTLGLTGCSEEAPGRLEKLTGQFLSPSRLSSAEDLDLDTDDESSYSFNYGEDEFHAEFLKDTWTIYESYKIKNPEDILIITADHGNDPTFAGNSHTRENVPVIIYSRKFLEPKKLEPLKTLADIGATIADNFEVDKP